MRFVTFAMVLAVSCSAARPSANERHLIYLHGRIIQEQQSPRPHHPEHGHYELQKIVEAFRDHGFVVSAPLRPRGQSVGEAADETVARVRALLDAGVPPERITIAGASMGSWIALLTSVRLGNPRVGFVLLSPCPSTNLAAVAAAEGRWPKGRLLFVRDESDVPRSDCPPWEGEARPGLVTREIVIDLGRGHGFLYQPFAEWVEPTAAW